MDLREATRVRKGEAYRHPWELSRTDSLILLLKNAPSAGCYADIGAGDRFFSRAVIHATGKTAYAVDRAYAEVERDGDMTCLPAVDMLPGDEIDYILLLDVLEHVEDEQAFLKEIVKKLKAPGRLIVTVPAFPFLFSSHDRFLEHRRRYTRKQLIGVLRKAGIIVERSFYFYFSLFIVDLLHVLAERAWLHRERKKDVGSWSFRERHPLTHFLRKALNSDFAICKFMGRLRIYAPGLSICCLCRKRSA